MPRGFIDFNENASMDEKLQVLKQNERTYNELQREIDNPALGTVIKKGIPQEEEKVIDYVPMARSSEVTINRDFMAFFDKLATIALDDDFENNLKLLLSPTDYRFNNYIFLSKLKIYESLVLLSNMAYEDKDVNAPEIISYVHELQTRYAFLDTVMEEKTLIDESSGILNDLFFLESGDKVNFFESLSKDITKDFYDRIFDILQSLRTGYIKNFKYLGEKRFFEIRSDIVRVLFARLGPNKFLILDVFLKKKKSSSEYWSRMYSLKDILTLVKPYYKDISEDDAEVQKHLGYYMDIMELLKNKKREI